MPELKTGKSPKNSVARYREFVADSNESEDRKTLANRALDTYEHLAEQKTVQRDELEPIIEAAQHPHKFVWDVGTVFLVKLAGSQAAAREVIAELANHKKADVRNTIVWALHAAWNENLPRDFVLQLLRSALADRSKKVRQQALKNADLLQLKELVEDLGELLQTEKNEDVLKSLRFHLAMMTDGYVLEHHDRDELVLTVKKEAGWSGRLITQKEIDEGRLPEIIRQMQNRPF